MLTGVIICSSSDGKGVIKGTWSVGSPSFLGRSLAADTTASTYSRASYVMLGRATSRMCTTSASVTVSDMMFAAMSVRIPHGSDPVAVSVVEARVLSVVEVSVDAEAFET